MYRTRFLLIVIHVRVEWPNNNAYFSLMGLLLNTHANFIPYAGNVSARTRVSLDEVYDM